MLEQKFLKQAQETEARFKLIEERLQEFRNYFLIFVFISTILFFSAFFAINNNQDLNESTNDHIQLVLKIVIDNSKAQDEANKKIEENIRSILTEIKKR